MRDFKHFGCIALLVLVSACSKSQPLKPSAAPAKTKQERVKTDNAAKNEDSSGICANVPDYTGVCDEDVGELVWFCLENDLYLLDCGELGENLLCDDDGTVWDCVEDDGDEDDSDEEDADEDDGDEDEDIDE